MCADSLNLNFLVVLILLARGPHTSRYQWIGWSNGRSLRKTKVEVTLEDGKPEGREVDGSLTPQEVVKEKV